MAIETMGPSSTIYNTKQVQMNIGFRYSNRSLHQRVLFSLVVSVLLCLVQFAGASDIQLVRFQSDIEKLVSMDDRSIGSKGNRAAARYIKQQFEQLGLEKIGKQIFSQPIRRHGGSRLDINDRVNSIPIQPVLLNAISPQSIPATGIQTPLVYVGEGELHQMNGKAIKGAIVMMEIDSGNNWLHAASLGAVALIYLDSDTTPNILYQDQMELSPIHFPRFRIRQSDAKSDLGDYMQAAGGIVRESVRLFSKIEWDDAEAENVYGLIPGVDPDLSEQLVIVEAFYDSSAYIPGQSPGAGEAVGLASLLNLARFLKQNPPGRSVLLVATSGHAQTLAGMREMVWSIQSRSKDIRQIERELKASIKQTENSLSVLETARSRGVGSFQKNETEQDSEQGSQLLEAVNEMLKTEVDRISRILMRLRMEQQANADQKQITQLVEERTLLRRLGWRSSLGDAAPAELAAIEQLIPVSIEDHRKIVADSKSHLKEIKSSQKLRRVVKALEPAAVVSLHLSSHGDGFGAFNYGWLQSLRPRINRTPNYRILNSVLEEAAGKLANGITGPLLYRDTLRPSGLRTWQSYFFDKPPLGGEISALAGLLGFTFATVHDARPRWGTPSDTIEHVNFDYAHRQSLQLNELISEMCRAERLHDERLPRAGFTTVGGRARFLRHGELFPDQPAPGTVLMAFQGPGRYYARVDHRGMFYLKGVSTSSLVRDKVIIEGYKFDPETGGVIWAIDKPQTGKPAYRLKIRRSATETTLVIFGCRQTTLFNLLEPRSFRYMTKIQLIDARREASPVRYWWSRIDTRSSIIASIYLEPGTPFKMTLSDTILRKKMILLNASEEQPTGMGFVVDDWPDILHTDFRVASDMWALLGPRIDNLERHGIYNERIDGLRNEGMQALRTAQEYLNAKVYDRFAEAATRSWALASRVYNDVEDTQKDVLFGVLFYIALFVPFAFCAERLLFSFSNIHKRILGFCGILLLLIAVIYNVHPAFRLAYSPTVVILAFFIMGLSLIVTLIIYFRFEEEMNKLQRRASQERATEIGRWKAFVASFLLGVSNLRRRRLRTALTCTTLIILTFTVMSFTSVKSMRHHSRLMYQPQSPYQGYFFKNFNWKDLPPEALDTISNHFEGKGVAAPRVWLEDQDPTRSPLIPVRLNDRLFEARGMVGLSAEEPGVTDMDRILIGGRWFEPGERRAILLPDRIAADLGIDPQRLDDVSVLLWGMPFQVVGVFSGSQLMERVDLDGEPLTPVTFPSEVTADMTDQEMEALESGEDIFNFQSRYQHTDGNLTVIVPYRQLLSQGGHLKAISIRPQNGEARREQAQHLVDRFGLMLFSGEPDGIFVYHASDTMSYSGVPNIVIPLIIAVFIVLNTMIGSVVERKREIGIYTSVGLAPSHVSFLFIAEALAFAVLSVVLGYLLAQVTASLFAGTSLWSGITVNYSSMSGVAAMILVILVVLVSVIYPSRVAAEIAIPDVNRSWRLPDTVDNRLEVTLPFLMNPREHLSIGGFLLEYFDSYKDVSHGLFSSGELEFTMAACQIPEGTASSAGPAPGQNDDPDEFLQIVSNIWLAPFDFGIMQKVAVSFCKSAEEPGFLEIRVRLERLAGEANAWRRINKAFLHNLRKQLLVWRSLDGPAKQYYEQFILASGRTKGLEGAMEIHARGRNLARE